MIEIQIGKRHDVQRGLRRLKKAMLREKVFEEMRKRRYFEKPSVRRRARAKNARFKAMLQQRYADF